MTESNLSNKELNPTVLKKIQLRVFSYEYENHSTKRLSDSEMVTKIRKAIDEMVRLEDNI